jgi:hypothetical protein
LLEGLQGFPTLKQIVSLNIGLKRIISDYNQGHIIRELRTRGNSSGDWIKISIEIVFFVRHGYTKEVGLWKAKYIADDT